MRQAAQLVAGVTKPYDVGGNFFYLETLPAGQLSVRFFRGNRQLDEEIEATERGWQASPDGGFDRIELTSTLTQAVVFHVVKGAVGVNVFSGTIIGAVTATPALTTAAVPVGADAITEADRVFEKEISHAAVAGQTSAIQLRNQVGSGKIVYLDEVTLISVTTAQNFEHGHHDASIGGVLSAGISRKDGVTNGAVEFRSLQGGVIGFTRSGNIRAGNEASRHYRFDPPVRLTEGHGYLFDSQTVNLTVRMGLVWREY